MTHRSSASIDSTPTSSVADRAAMALAAAGRAMAVLLNPATDPVAAAQAVQALLAAVAGRHRAAGVDGQHLGHRLAAQGSVISLTTGRICSRSLSR